MNIKLSNQGFILVLLPLLVQVTFMVIFLGMLQQAEVEIANERHRREIVNGMNYISSLVLSTVAENSLQVDTSGKAKSAYARDILPAEFARVKALAADEPKDLARIKKFENAWLDGYASLNQLKKLANEGNTVDTVVEYRKFQKSFERISKFCQLAAKSNREFESNAPDLRAESRNRQKQALFVFLALDVLLALCLCIYFNNRTATRLNILMRNARNLGMEKPIEESLPGNDEITELQKTFVTVATELSSIRARERAILDNAGDVICSIDQNLVITSASSASEKLWGHSEEDLRGMRLATLIHSDDWEATRNQLAEIKSSNFKKDIENRVRTSAGDSKYMLWNVNWSNERESFFCVAHDVSERRKLEAMKADFMNMISHDIRSPLNSVASFLTILDKDIYGELNEKGRKMRLNIDRSIQLVIRLVSDLLDLEKVQSGMLSLSIESVNTFELMQRSVDVVKALAETKSIVLTIEGEELQFFADQDRLVQVLVNLLSNAIKFSPQEGEIIVASYKEDDRIVLTVTDQGPGINSEHLASIFDRYYQVSTKDATVRGGTGLGLAIAKAIVEHHHGTIHAESDGETGSCFVIDLPGTLESTEEGKL